MEPCHPTLVIIPVGWQTDEFSLVLINATAGTFPTK